jgi:RNA recognition motif-containing protein
MIPHRRWAERTAMGKRVVYVAGLSEAVSERQLRDLFGAYGLVASERIVRHKRSGKSAGYGFVEMVSAEQALMAVVGLEGAEVGGRCLRLHVTSLASGSANQRNFWQQGSL